MFTNNEFRNLFQNAFDLEAWKRLMVNYFDVQTTLKNPELLEKFSNDRLEKILQYYLNENEKKRKFIMKMNYKNYSS